MEEVRETVVKYFFEVDYRSKGAFYANLLLDSAFEMWGVYVTKRFEYSEHHQWEPRSVRVWLGAQAYTQFTSDGSDYEELQRVTASTLPEHKIEAWQVNISLKRRDGRKGWDDMLRRTLSEEDADNQGAYIRLPLLDDLSLRYRSQAEMAISKALRRRGVLFFPLPAAVFGNNKLEPDFLVCDKGRWGVLEVQGEVFHNMG